jgi:hypothetical protein
MVVTAAAVARRGGSRRRGSSSFMSDKGILNERRLQAQVVKFVFLALGDNAYSPQRLLDPIIQMAHDLILPRAS